MRGMLAVWMGGYPLMKGEIEARLVEIWVKYTK